VLGNTNKHIVLKRIICIKLVNKYRFVKLILLGSSLLISARHYGEVVLPDAASGQGLGTLASFAHRNDFSREGGKAVTVQALPACR